MKGNRIIGGKLCFGMLFCCFLMFENVHEVLAQTDYMTEAEIERDTRKSVRKSEKYRAPYKDSHLNTTIYKYERGESGRKQKKYSDGRDKYRFNSRGKPVKNNFFRRLFGKKRK